MEYLSITTLEQQKRTDPIYVINTAPDSDVADTGEILLTIPKVNGTGSDNLTIAQTWLPQLVTAQIPRIQILNSSEFRGAVHSKLIALISEKDALRLLKSDGATEEQLKLNAAKKHVKDAGAARTIKSEVRMIGGNKDEDEEDTDNDGTKARTIVDGETSVAVQARAGVEDVEKGVSAQFNMWVDKLNTLTDVGIVNEIKGRRKFSNRELKFLEKRLSTKFVKSLALVKRNLGN